MLFSVTYHSTTNLYHAITVGQCTPKIKDSLCWINSVGRDAFKHRHIGMGRPAGYGSDLIFFCKYSKPLISAGSSYIMEVDLMNRKVNVNQGNDNTFFFTYNLVVCAL